MDGGYVMCTKPQFKCIIATWYCLHHMAESDAICNQIWLLYLFNLKLVMVIWHCLYYVDVNNLLT
jgi:hypothetical protein